MNENATPVTAIVVDDEKLNREVMTAHLSAAGCDVVGTAADGPEAVQLFREARPDFVLLDINMPGLNGIDVLRAIKEDEPSAYVVMMTAVDGAGALEDCMIAGARDYIRKGIPADQIAPRIKRHIDRLRK